MELLKVENLAYLLLGLIIINMVKSHIFFITICAASDSGGMENYHE
ncbi:hypothetical protein [Methylomusa anaerophila]|nr:hypothetical protein [Methylomusa anaerophila]